MLSLYIHNSAKNVRPHYPSSTPCTEPVTSTYIVIRRLIAALECTVKNMVILPALLLCSFGWTILFEGKTVTRKGMFM